MAQPYIGEIRIFAGNFAPAGWGFCDGTLLPISEYETLFNLIGTSYGGDGESTFALPDLRGRFAIHQGNGYVLAETGGVEEVTLTVQQIPSHTHTMVASSSTGTQNGAAGNLLASGSSISIYRTGTPTSALSPQMIGPVGGSQPHPNMQPYLCVNYIISFFGIFPSQT